MTTIDPGPERLFIGNEFVAASDGYDIVNPATEQVVGTAPDGDASDIAAAVEAAREAFCSWSTSPRRERADLLGALADALHERRDGFVPLIQAETGATIKVARGLQISQVVKRFRRYAMGVMEPRQIPLPPEEVGGTEMAPGAMLGAVVERAPVGVVAAITSYNFPLTNMAGKVAPALAMGNPVVVKPAPQDPLAVLKFAEVARDVGFPAGVINVVTGAGPEAGEALVASPDVDMVSFTGSTAVGRRIGSVAGGNMTRMLLELGGKGACIVLDDGDVKKALRSIASTWAFHSGQICTAPTRVIAHRSVHDQVVAGLEAFAGHLTVGDPLDEKTVVGPVISEQHRDRIEGCVASARDDGARVVVGGTRPETDTGFYVAPTLLADCTTDMAAVREELFGPVVTVMAVDDDDEAVERANSTSYGLYDYVWSADATRAMGIARRLRSGGVGINTMQRHSETPFGGMKQSGVGRDGGSFSLHAYSEPQSIVWEA
jgi:acyl-CoA reductase-like NAD-dependent aldehyde dehydrogenase